MEEDRKEEKDSVRGTEVMSTGSLNRGTETIPLNSETSFMPLTISIILGRRSSFLPL